MLDKNQSPVKASFLPLEDWGLIGYEDSNLKQLKIIQKIYEQKKPGQLIFCSHPPIVTTGRATKPIDLWGWKGDIFESPRGGRATYHGPNQLVIYPLVNLSFGGFKVFKKKDVTSYLRLLEKIVIDTLAVFQVEARQRCEKIDVNGEQLEATGVWVGDYKIASIGIAVRRWVTYHGVAINLFKDNQAFKGINPCGFSSNIMTSVEQVLGKEIKAEDIKKEFTRQFNQKII